MNTNTQVSHSPLSVSSQALNVCVILGFLKLHDAPMLRTLGSRCWPGWVVQLALLFLLSCMWTFCQVTRPFHLNITGAGWNVFPTKPKTVCLSSQNCHELEKMDLEECILVRELVVALFTTNFMLVVFVSVGSGNVSWLLSVWVAIRLYEERQMWLPPCQEGEWVQWLWQFLSYFRQTTEMETEKKWHRRYNFFCGIQN